MKIIPHEEFFSKVKGRHLLLDTNIFIDAFTHPAVFAEFFNLLREKDVTLVTLDCVLIEFLKGAQTDLKLQEKQKYVDQIVDTYLPSNVDLKYLIIDLLKKYRIEGKDLSFPDLLLGATLSKYGSKIFLLTKDVSDFPTTIFERVSYVTLLESRNIRNYGLYGFA